MSESQTPANNSVETNRHPALPLDAGGQFGSASYVPPSLSAAGAQFCRSAAMRTIMLITLALTAQVTVGADKADELVAANVKAAVTKEMLSTLAYEQVPDKWRTKVEDESTEAFTKKVFWRGRDKVLGVLWRQDWTGTQSNMFVATVYDGEKQIAKIHGLGATTSITQPKAARAPYNMVTTINDDGTVSLMFSSDAGYLQVIEVKGRDTHLMDDIAHTKMAVGIGQIGRPLLEAMDELRTTKPKQNQSKGAEPDGPANGSQPIRSETNTTPSAAGSRR